MTRLQIRSVLLGLLAVAAVLATAGPAAAKAPCWKQLINDWYDGRIDKTYPVRCYEEAINHLPSDVEAYSSAVEDIRRALQKRIADEKRQTTAPTKTTGDGGGGSQGDGGGGSQGGAGPTSPPTKGGGKGGTGKPSGGTTKPSKASRPGKTTNPPTASPGRDPGGGVVGEGLRRVGPKDADSIPIPLIVLAGIALVLLAAGAAGLVARRLQARRVPIRSSGRTPPQA